MCELAAAAAASAAAAAAAAVAVAGFISNVGIAASVAMPAAADPDRPVAETGIPHHGVTSLAHAIVFAPKVPDMCQMMKAWCNAQFDCNQCQCRKCAKRKSF